MPRATSLMQAHWPSLDSRHKLTLLSPPDTAKMLPVSDQLTLHTTSSNVCRMEELHAWLSSLLQITTRLSCEQEAITERASPTEGAQATSRIQSVWISSLESSAHWSAFSIQIYNTQLALLFCAEQ